MISFTANQWAIVALVLVLGWLLGLMSRSGSARWRSEARAEAVARRDAETRLAAANTRIAELERTQHPINAGTASAVGAAAAGRRDDLTLIRGIDHARETRLNDSGLHGYRDVEALSDTDAATTETRLGLPAGTIVREQWREQAATLRNEGVEAHRSRWG